MDDLKEGWGWPLNSKKAHYFQDARALCGKWLYTGRLELGNNASLDNCMACRRKLDKMQPVVCLTDSSPPSSSLAA